MSNKFTLSRKPETVLVTELRSSDGRDYPIDPSFRVVLACLRINNDPNIEMIGKALYISKKLFLNNPPPDMPELFCAYVMGDGEAEEANEPLVDYEFDAEAIYASFRQQYGIDLLRDDLHWVEFRALTLGLNEDTPFGQRVKIRGMDTSDFTGKSLAKLRKYKESVAIKPRISDKEAALRDELQHKLDAGEDPADIIAQLKGV